MSLQQTLRHEFKALGLACLFFGSWIAVLVLLKELLLAEYEIKFHGFSMALIGALVLSKVVLVLEYVPLGGWVRAQPSWVDVLVRTFLYSFGVLVVLVIEKAFEARHDHGGFGPSLRVVFQHPDMPHVGANTICISGALLAYNTLSMVRRHLGQGGLVRLFLKPLPPESAPGGKALRTTDGTKPRRS